MSHRFWSATVAAAGALTTATPIVFTINPVAGLVCKVAGLALSVIGAAGSAYYGVKSNRTVDFSSVRTVAAKLKDSIVQDASVFIGLLVCGILLGLMVGGYVGFVNATTPAMDRPTSAEMMGW